MGRNKLTPQEIELKKVVSQNLNDLLSKTTSKKIDVHRQLNIPQSTVSDYFSGKTLPSEENIVKLARFFNVNPYDIDPRMVKGNVINDKLRVKLLTTFDDLNDKNKRKVVDYADTQLKDQWREENIHSINELQRTYTVDVLGAVSAGTGEWLDEEQHNHVAVPEQPPVYDFAVQVNGDSMEPMFADGQIIYVKRVEGTEEVRDNQIVIAELNGNAYVKKIAFDGDRDSCRLISLNKKYTDIIVKPEDSFKVIGVVVI